MFGDYAAEKLPGNGGMAVPATKLRQASRNMLYCTPMKAEDLDMSENDGLWGETPGMVFRPGESFHGYMIEKQIGKGGLGTIWLGRHQMLDTLFAIKVLDPDIAEEKPEYVKRFVREAKLATRIRHPHLVAVHDAGYDDARGVYFLVMDYVRGDTLRSTIAFGGPQPEKEAVRIILQVADVLAAAQRFGMVHRDLKPENIMLTTEGAVKLLDLGIANARRRLQPGHHPLRVALRAASVRGKHAVRGLAATARPFADSGRAHVQRQGVAQGVGCAVVDVRQKERRPPGLAEGRYRHVCASGLRAASAQ